MCGVWGSFVFYLFCRVLWACAWLCVQLSAHTQKINNRQWRKMVIWGCFRKKKHQIFSQLASCACTTATRCARHPTLTSITVQAALGYCWEKFARAHSLCARVYLLFTRFRCLFVLVFCLIIIFVYCFVHTFGANIRTPAQRVWFHIPLFLSLCLIFSHDMRKRNYERRVTEFAVQYFLQKSNQESAVRFHGRNSCVPRILGWRGVCRRLKNMSCEVKACCV